MLWTPVLGLNYFLHEIYHNSSTEDNVAAQREILPKNKSQII